MTTDLIAVWAEALNPAGHPIMGVSATNSLPWDSIPADLAHFRRATKDRVLVMGRRTFDSLPVSMKTPEATSARPLMILTNTIPLADEPNLAGYWHAGDFGSPTETLDWARAVYRDKGIAVIGGPKVIEQFAGLYDRAFVTTVHDRAYEGDVPAPSRELLRPGYWASTKTVDSGLSITEYTRRIA